MIGDESLEWRGHGPHQPFRPFSSADDTDDTIPPGGETPTIQRPPTMKCGGTERMPNSRMSRAAGKAKTKTAKNKAKNASESGAGSARTGARSKQKFKAMQSPPDAERYALALESINENLYDWDIENDTVYFAPGLFKILGLKAEHMRRPSDWTERIHPDDRPPFKYTLAEHLKGKTPRLLME